MTDYWADLLQIPVVYRETTLNKWHNTISIQWRQVNLLREHVRQAGGGLYLCEANSIDDSLNKFDKGYYCCYH